jgi:putative transposase
MRLLDEQYTPTPFYGVPKMTAWLKRQGLTVGPKRGLMRKMGLCAIFPKKKTSSPGASTEKYPYLLSCVSINRPNQVWSTDLTYIRLRRGFVYLVAVMDWFSRYVLAWELSNSQDVFFCLQALDKALLVGKPDIFNSDQGSQFTSEAFTSRLKAAKIAISRDGRGRVFDNIFVERLWRSVKYEEVYLNDYQSVTDAREGLANYFNFYNSERLHQSLSYLTPQQVHFGLEPELGAKGGKPISKRKETP